MADWLALYVVTFVLGIGFIIFVIRQVQFVQPGELGLLFVAGVYRKTLFPGFNVVPMLSKIRRVKAGGGPNGSLGLVGVAEPELSPDGPLGVVRIGERELPARAVSTIRRGSTVRVIEDGELGVVLVAEELGPGPKALEQSVRKPGPS